jgi:hypothetical protein
VRDNSTRKEPTGGIQKHGKSLAAEIQKESTGGIREETSRRDAETRIQVHVNSSRVKEKPISRHGKSLLGRYRKGLLGGYRESLKDEYVNTSYNGREDGNEMKAMGYQRWGKGRRCRVQTPPPPGRYTIILPFIKPAKDPKNPNSYRPISLTSSLYKIMEKMATNRLIWFLESNNILTQAQTGFRKGRSTLDQIIKIQDEIYKYIKNGGYTVGTFLDFEKAYDMLWRTGLLAKLKKMGINGRMFAFIKDFISDRTFQVQIGKERSSTWTLENGTPQGSVISPILFLIMINDMSEVINGVHLSLFADDSATYKSEKNLQYIMKEI